LDIDIHGAVRVCHEPGAIADKIPLERIRYESFFLVGHGQRPEGVVGWESFRREVHDVVVRSGQRVAPTIYVRPPIHGLLRQVYRAGKYSRMCAARVNMPMLRRPHPKAVIQPLLFTRLTRGSLFRGVRRPRSATCLAITRPT